MSNVEDMDVDMSFLSNGLQQGGDSQESIDQLLENLEWSDFLRSPGPDNAFSNYGGFSPLNLDMQNDENDPMLSEGAPMAPQAHAVTTSHIDESERADSFRDIEPMNLGSSDARMAYMADPSALRESFGSIELNTSQNPHGQQIDQAPGLAAAQRQPHALPDSSQTPGPVVTPPTAVSSSRTSPDTTTVRPKQYFEGYELPIHYHFNVTVKFMSTLILEKKITKEGGCLLHYHHPSKQTIEVPPEMERVSIPIGIKNDQDETLREFPWVKPKQKRFTELILNSFERGVEIYSKEGNIYAKRKSDTKLFWHNTEGPSGQAHELKRNEPTEVFNFAEFQENLTVKLRNSYVLNKKPNIGLPAIWFSFAQKWDRPSSPINQKLVWARIDPIRACEMVFDVNPEVRPIAIDESLHTSLFAFSHETSSNASK